MTMLTITVKASLGDDITREIIPEMIDFANRLKVGIRCDLNDVFVTAYPGDDALHLAIAWRKALGGVGKHKTAFAFTGKRIMDQA